MLAYHLLWTLVGGPLLFGCRFYRNPRLMQRLGCLVPNQEVHPGGIWVHALSVGEVKSAIPLVRRLREDYPKKSLVLSSTTRQGLDLASKELGGEVDAIITMPLDFWWSYRRVISLIKPNLFLLVETDIWPGVLRHLRVSGAQSLLINGRISRRTHKSYKRAPRLAQRLFTDLKLCLMQTEQDRERLLSIGVPSHKVLTVGNIKFDRPFSPMDSKERGSWRRLFGLEENSVVLVAGSTHGEESYMILEIFLELQGRYPDLVLILAPRKTEQARELYDAAVAKGKPCIVRSQADGSVKGPGVVILDTVGELERIYGLGQLSFVGGSLIPFGGHNLLEPASFGIPVLYGPHTDNFTWMSEALENAGGGRRVRDKLGLREAIDRLLANDGLRIEMGRAASSFVKQNQGALDRVMDHVAACLMKGEART